jgi:hypothetical protein
MQRTFCKNINEFGRWEHGTTQESWEAVSISEQHTSRNTDREKVAGKERWHAQSYDFEKSEKKTSTYEAICLWAWFLQVSAVLTVSYLGHVHRASCHNAKIFLKFGSICRPSLLSAFSKAIRVWLSPVKLQIQSTALRSMSKTQIANFEESWTRNNYPQEGVMQLKFL